jgi:hypothetical protein
MTTDLLDLARRVMGSSQGLDGSVAATTLGDDSPAPHLRADPRGEDPDDPRGVDLLAIVRGYRMGDATDTRCAKSEIRGNSPSTPPRSAHLSRIAQPDAAGTVRLSPAELATREPGGHRRCYTCGQAADSTWDDGSPRWRHGHDPLTGQRWTMQPRRAPVGRLRTCPACAAEHAVDTTCGPVAGSGIKASDQADAGIDLLEAALAVFGDDVEQVSAVIDRADRPDRSNDWCAISERSAISPDHGRHPRGQRLRDKREKGEKGVVRAELIPLFDEGIDGSSPPGTPA